MMPLIYTELWKALGEQNWDIIYTLSERGYQLELSQRLVAEEQNHFFGFVIQEIRPQKRRKPI